MDKTLDEIISAKPKGNRRGGTRRQSGRAQVLGKPVVTPVQRARAAPAIAAAKVTTGQAQPADKIIVSNLPSDVNEAQVKELFASTVGPVRELTLTYDAAGRSKGIASLQFSKKGDGTKAYQQYNNRLIDGKRPMKIEIVVDPARPVPLASRVGAPPATNGGQAQATRTGASTRGRRRGRGGVRKGDRPAKSAADLDAEMEDYTASNAPATAAAA